MASQVSALSKFRQSPLYAALQRKLRHDVPKKNTVSHQEDVNRQVDAIIDFVAGGGDIDKALRSLNVNDAPIVENMNDFSDAVIAALIRAGYDSDLIEVLYSKGGIDVYVDGPSKLTRLVMRQTLANLADVEQTATPEEMPQYGTYVYHVTPNEDLGSYAELMARNYGLNKSDDDDKDSKDAEAGRMQEHDHAIGATAFIVLDSYNKEDPVILPVIVRDCERTSQEHYPYYELYSVQAKDGAMFTRGNDDLYKTRGAAKAKVKKIKQQRIKWEGVDRLSNRMKTLTESSPRLRQGASYVRRDTLEPFVVDRTISSRLAYVRKPGASTGNVVRREPLERGIVSGAIIDTSAKNESRFTKCPDCGTELTESDQSTFLCSDCGYRVLVT